MFKVTQAVVRIAWLLGLSETPPSVPSFKVRRIIVAVSCEIKKCENPAIYLLRMASPKVRKRMCGRCYLAFVLQDAKNSGVSVDEINKIMRAFPSHSALADVTAADLTHTGLFLQ